MIRIAGLVRTSTVDFPGLLSAVVFMPGCNFTCFYCHNQAVLQPDQPLLDLQDVFAFLEKRKDLLDGIVISGGEPLLQPDLPVFLKIIKEMGYRIKLDTNGSKPRLLERLLCAGLLDKIAVDYKAPWARYPDICGCDPADVRCVEETFTLLASSSAEWEVRTTVFPQLTDEDLQTMADAVPCLPAWHLQLYRRPPLFRKEDRFRIEAQCHTPADLRRMASVLRKRQPAVATRC